MSCSRCRRIPKRLPYGAKGNSYCVCDTDMIIVVSKKAARQKAKKEIKKDTP